ncbi:helix-turn-helix domain-containing transcriptional regulator [Aureimonas frigidaquae]|uniref:helix-turn-helix domain-containing transcriptional regulator n=1 Tax=Aureimonas frigidaquae TaxID=424757 RepID=UPI0038995449
MLLCGGDKSSKSLDIGCARPSRRYGRNCHDGRKIQSLETADYLQTEEDIVAYLKAAMVEGDPALLAAAWGDVARTRTSANSPAPRD